MTALFARHVVLACLLLAALSNALILPRRAQGPGRQEGQRLYGFRWVAKWRFDRYLEHGYVTYEAGGAGSIGHGVYLSPKKHNYISKDPAKHLTKIEKRGKDETPYVCAIYGPEDAIATKSDDFEYKPDGPQPVVMIPPLNEDGDELVNQVGTGSSNGADTPIGKYIKGLDDKLDPTRVLRRTSMQSQGWMQMVPKELLPAPFGEGTLKLSFLCSDKAEDIPDKDEETSWSKYQVIGEDEYKEGWVRWHQKMWQMAFGGGRARDDS